MEKTTLNTEAKNPDESKMKNIAVITLLNTMFGVLPKAWIYS